MIRWLRPEYQNPQGIAQGALAAGEAEAEPAVVAKRDKIDWPATLAEQAKAVRAALAAQPGPVTPGQLAGMFKGGRGRAGRVGELLETLTSLGQAREVEAGRYVS